MTDNIVEAVFAGRRSARTRAVYQYDYGMILKPIGLELPSTYEVHFGVSATGPTTTQLGNAEGVEIPDAYLQSGSSVYAYIYLHSGEDDGETVYSIVIPVIARGQITDEQPTPVEQGIIEQAIAALNSAVERAETAGQVRVTSLTSTPLRSGAEIVEAIGIPQYIEHPEEYSSLGLTKKGWYVFARIACPAGRIVTSETRVSGAAGSLIVVGSDYIDVAVRYDVAALAVAVVVTWGPDTETFVFRANDLAFRNLDYRTTFYIYDIAEFARWEWKLTEDANFKADQNYYTKNGDVYTLAEVQTVQYNLTADATFQTGKKYYTREGDVYTEATVTAGEAVTTDTYYEASDVPVPADTYYVHAKLIFEGMSKNVTYQFNEIVDCPQEYVLPEIEDDGHGAWFEIRLRHAGSYSSTLTVPEGVKVATEHTQAETKGFNMVDLHYQAIDGVKIWRFMNTHSSIPT